MNTQKYRWILYFITATILITVSVQFFWNYKNYQLNKQRVTNEIQLSLDNSIEEYYSELAKTDFLTIIETDAPSPHSNLNIDGTKINIMTRGDKKGKSNIDYRIVNIQDSLLVSGKHNIKYDSIKGITQWSESGDGYTFMKPNQLKSVRVLKGKKAQDSLAILETLKPILISIKRDSLQYGKIDSLLHEQLGKKSIKLLYAINHTKNDTLFYSSNNSLKTTNLFIANTKSTFLKPNEKIQLLYKNPFSETLRRSLIGILISFLLSAAIISCLFYLLKIIKHQKQLAEVKNDLISNITHEFKTPIATIGVALESIKNFNVIDDKEKTKTYIDMSNNQLTKLNLMVEKLLETATLDSDNLILNKEGVNITDLLLSIIEKHRMQTTKTIHFNSSNEHIQISADVFHLENALNNIVDNANKYGGNNITIDFVINKNTILITVSDDGNTLTEANKSKIFEKFYRVPKGNTHDIKGFGIGLYYTKKIIEKHGGSIHLDLNNNTTFKVTIPNE